MKSINKLWILLLVSMLIACGSGSADSESDKISAKTYDTGSISLSLGNGIQSRMISPNWTEVRYYDIFGFGPNEKTFEKLGVDKNLDEVTISDIASGEWKIQVTAKDIFNHDEILGGGETTVIVQRGVTSTAEIVVKPLTGNGTLNLSFSWNKDYINNPVIVAELVNSANETIELPLDMDGTLVTASYSSEQGPGYYTLLVRLYDGEELLAGYTETVRILQGLTSSGGHVFDQVIEPIGNLNLSFIEDMNQPIGVSLESDDLSLRLGESTTFTATVNEEINNPNFQWYLNGSLQSENTSTAFTLTSDAKKVDYVTVVVKNEDSTRYGDGEIRMATSDLKFDAAYEFATGWARHSIQADIDLDGDTDIVVAGLNGSATIYYNEGGRFDNVNKLSLNADWDIDLADMNADGRLDLIFASYHPERKIHIYFNQEDGTFVDSGIDVGITDEFRGVSSVDIDGDSDIDLIVSGVNTGVRILTNENNIFTVTQTFEGTTYKEKVDYADLDGDSDIDLVVAGYHVLINDGTGTFTADQTFTLSGSNVEIGDLDNDGDLDIVSSADGVYLNNGEAQFNLGWKFPLYGSNVKLGDIDNDGDLDVLHMIQYNGSHIYLNGGDATFVDSLLKFEGRSHVTGQMGDFDQDGKMDIFLGNRSSPMIQIFNAQ